MDNKLNYQQAKQVRERSIKDLIADELIRGKGVGGAIKGAIGLRTEARIKGIKEKFDPLNIVKFLTFGSRLGPALYGKLFGRSRKDIEYFTGRASAIGERKKKITGLPGDGEDTSGMKVVLNQILSFLQKSHEDDMILREKENNLRESAKLDDDRRHNELLKALGGTGGGTGTAQKVKTGGLLDGIMNIINGLRNQIQAFIDDIKNIKNLLNGFSWISKLSWMARFSNPYALAAALVAAGIFAIYNHNKDIREAASSGDVEKLKGFFSNSSGTEADMYGVDSGYNKESVRNALQEAANRGSEKAQEALDNFDKLTTDTSPAKTEKQLMDEYLYSKKGFYDAGNGNYKHINDPNKKPTQSDFDAAAEYAKSKMATPTPSPTNNTTSTTEEGMKDYVPRVVPQSVPTPPPPVVETPKSQAVSNATNVNLDLELDKSTSGRNQVLQDRTNVVNQKAAVSQKVPMHFVRNKDATFQRMIYNSTRLV
jgi:hypothetical protein